MGRDLDWRAWMTAAVLAIAAAVCLVAASGAMAKITPTLKTTYTLDSVVPTGTSGATTVVTNDDGRLGAHDDFTVEMNYSYGATGTMGSYGVEDPDTYPAPSDFDENIRNLVVDTPPGLIGNPNAVPYGDRCDISTFETSTCPDSSTVGSFWVDVILLQKSSDLALDLATLGPGGPGKTRVSLLKTDPEVPAQIGIYVHAITGFDDVRTILKIDPKTEEGLRLRSKTITDIPSTIHNANDGEDYEIRIDRMKLRLFGRLANSHAFMTNPMSCESWDSQMWATARFFNDNADSDPLAAGTNTYKSSNVSSVQPDCSNAGQVPFPITGKVAISTPARDTSPDFNFTIDNPGIQSDDPIAATGPKKVVTTIPAAINVDVQQLGRTCTLTAFTADQCPVTSKVGNVTIKTPLISAGLTGDVYLVKRQPTGLPDLGLRVRGAITFTQLGSNRYVGPKFNQIETTFDNIPQVGFSQLAFHLDGGKNGLLRTGACPIGNKQPGPGTFAYTFTGYTGATVSSSAALNMANCFGIQKLRSFKCVYRRLRFQPTYTSRARVKKVTMKVDKKRIAVTKKSPFKFNVSAARFKKGKHKIEVQARYDDGTLSVKRSSFKKCGRR